MRVQFVPFPVPAHFSIMVPLAWALQTAGHDVRILTPPNMVDTVLGAGLVAVPYGGDADLTQADSMMGWLSRIGGLDSDGTAADDELRNLALAPIVVYYGAEVTRDTMSELIEATRGYDPDLVVWDTHAAQASAAARVAGAASARMVWGFDHVARMRTAFTDRAARDGAEDSIAILYGSFLERHGLSFDERDVLGDVTVNSLPILGESRVDVPTIAMRQFAFSLTTPMPPWVLEPRSRPRVCMTLGRSVRDVRGNDNYGIPVADLFEAVSDLDVEVVATMTAEQIPDGVKVPDNVRLIDYVPINVLMSTCSAVIHHSGGTTMMAAMWHCVPQVIVSPRSWGDPKLAKVNADNGSAVVIGVDDLTPDRLRTALLRVLDDPSYTEAAQRLRTAATTLPSPNDAVPALERLARGVRAERYGHVR